jgi:hypothetical protein
MTATIGTSTNTNTEASNLSPISVGSSSAVALLPPLSVLDVPYVRVVVFNSGNRDLWIRRYPASNDNDKRGDIVPAGERVELEYGSDIYTGEISGIMNSGPSADIYVVWY